MHLYEKDSIFCYFKKEDQFVANNTPWLLPPIEWKGQETYRNSTEPCSSCLMVGAWWATRPAAQPWWNSTSISATINSMMIVLLFYQIYHITEKWNLYKCYHLKHSCLSSWGTSPRQRKCFCIVSLHYLCWPGGNGKPDPFLFSDPCHFTWLFESNWLQAGPLATSCFSATHSCWKVRNWENNVHFQ